MGSATAETGRSRRVAARKETEEIVMVVEDREFKEAMGLYEGAVRHVKVERFEASGPGGIGPVWGGESVRESVHGGTGSLGKRVEGGDGEEEEDVVVVKGYTDVRKFDDAMEAGGFVRIVIDVDGRCMNTGSPAEPEWGTDTERVWVRRGSAELAALDALIAKAKARQWQWQCPPSPVHVPDPADEEMSWVD